MGAKFSPVIKGEVRFSGWCESLVVNVWFRDKTELQALVDALIELRDSIGDESDHVHLQHYDLAPGHPVGLAEVNFFRPGLEMTDLDKELTDIAVRDLGRVASGNPPPASP